MTVNLKILDATFSIDKSLADAYSDGPNALIAREGARHIKSAFAHAEKQFLNGSDNDSDGFNGLADALGLSSSQVFDAGGTTADTASSIYLARMDGSENELNAVTNGRIDLDETVVRTLEDTANGGRFSAYYTPILAWLGLQIGSAYSAFRICNVTEDSGATATDHPIQRAMEEFPSSRPATHIVMGSRSWRQLHKSRLGTNQSPTGEPAPRPTDVEGVPIIVTESITSTEAILA